jgi:hypothetical protein
MLTYKEGSTVEKGTYWDMESGRRIDVSCEAVLAGKAGARYIRMSPAAMLASGPVIGLLYAIVMPFIGIATAASLATRVLLGALYHLAMRSVSFGWRPQNAYLSGKKKHQKK